MEKHIFIVNPVSGKGKALEMIPKIEKIAKEKNWDYEIKKTKKNQSIKELLKNDLDQEGICYAVGGDGLINEVLNAIVDSKLKLAVIPAGSGNDFYKTIKDMKDGDYQIDIGKINHQYFANVACIGIDAEVANNIDSLRGTMIPASQLYNASIVYTFFKFKAKKVDFKTKIKEIKQKPMIISICNGAFYGGGYHIAPKASLTDGLFDVYYVDKFPKVRMLVLISKLRKGKHEGKHSIHKFRTNHVEIELDEEIAFNVDGEKLTGKRFVLDIVPKKVMLHCQKDFEEVEKGEKRQ